MDDILDALKRAEGSVETFHSLLISGMSREQRLKSDAVRILNENLAAIRKAIAKLESGNAETDRT